jgi:hypothetical protein
MRKPTVIILLIVVLMALFLFWVYLLLPTEKDEYKIYSVVINHICHNYGLEPNEQIVLVSQTNKEDSSPLSGGIRRRSISGKDDFFVGNCLAFNYNTKNRVSIELKKKFLGGLNSRIVFISKEELEKNFNDNDYQEGWSRFSDRYPTINITNYSEFSRIGFNITKTKAIMWHNVEASSGNLSYYYLVEKINGKWVLVNASLCSYGESFPGLFDKN